MMRVLHVTAARAGWVGVVVCAAPVIYWFVVFAATFQLLGSPVRSASRGWLGPPPRDRSCLDDIGKVWEWTCQDVTVFERHRLGSRLWLRLNGLVPADQGRR